jgi:hypothetical protein
MEIRNVKIKVGATINLGNYEYYRADVELEAVLSQAEVDEGGLVDLMDTAQKELAVSLTGSAQATLKSIYQWDEPSENSDVNQKRAIHESDEYRWMVKLHPELAKDLLAEVVNEYFETKKAEAEAAEAGLTTEEVDAELNALMREADEYDEMSEEFIEFDEVEMEEIAIEPDEQTGD